MFPQMIAHLRGKLIAKTPSHTIVEAGGVGYELAITIPTYSGLPALSQEVALYVYTHVREDALALFGFLQREEKQLFEKLIAVSGIGPKLAITVLSGMSAEAVVVAIRGNDLAALTRIPGIGKKTAERMVLELRDKLDQFAAPPVTPVATAIEEDVISALVNLGYQRSLAERALSRIPSAKNGEKISFEVLFREALAVMAK
jgi:Holliday junction DNA helicase RuvA